jgi:hypothetical protein
MTRAGVLVCCVLMASATASFVAGQQGGVVDVLTAPESTRPARISSRRIVVLAVGDAGSCFAAVERHLRAVVGDGRSPSRE